MLSTAMRHRLDGDVREVPALATLPFTAAHGLCSQGHALRRPGH